MRSSEKICYELPSVSIDRLHQAVDESLKESRDDIAEILSNRQIPEANRASILKAIDAKPFDIQYDGAGSDPSVVAICVSLAALIKELTPLVKPFAENAAELAGVIGHDLWTMYKRKMLDKNVRLTEKGVQATEIVSDYRDRRMNGLTPAETKIMVAKTLALQAFEAHWRDLEKIATIEEFLEEINRFCKLTLASNNRQELAGYLDWFCNRLSVSLIQIWPQHADQLRAYIATLRSYVQTYDPEAQFREWLKGIASSARLYKRSLHPLPDPYPLTFRNENRRDLPLAGETTWGDLGSRTITLAFDLDALDLVSFSSVPWVLAHEYLCHCISNVESISDVENPQKMGCNPFATFEEGWMDRVQDSIVRDHVRSILPTADQVRVFEHWGDYLKKRKEWTRKSVQSPRLYGLEWGGYVAASFGDLLIEFRKKFSVDPIRLFRQISLDLNAICLDEDTKGRFVDRIGDYLYAGQSLSDARVPVPVIVRKRTELVALVLDAMKGDRCNVAALLKNILN